MKPWRTTSWTGRVPRRDIAGDLSSRAAATTLALSHHTMQPTNKLPAWYLRSKQRAPIPLPGSAGSLPSSCARPALLCLSFVQICRVRRPSTAMCAGRCAERVVKARCPHFSSWFCTFFSLPTTAPFLTNLKTFQPSDHPLYSCSHFHYFLQPYHCGKWVPVQLNVDDLILCPLAYWISFTTQILAASKTNIGLLSLPIWIHCIVLTRLAQFQGLRITSFAFSITALHATTSGSTHWFLFYCVFVWFCVHRCCFCYALLSLRVFLYGLVPSNHVLLCDYSPRMPSENDQSMPLPPGWIP